MTTRFTLSEISQAVARGKFTTGGTVTISLYRNASATPVTLDDNSCVELGATGHYIWPFSNITTAPTSYSDYLWVMTNGTPAEDQSDNYVFGGYPDLTSSLSGANSVTVSILESDLTPIADVEVQVLNSAQTLVIDTKTSNANGEVVFALDDGTYKLRCAKHQVSFTLPETLTVSGTTTDTVTGSPITLTPGSGAGECEVSIYTASQRPTAYLSSLAATATIKTLPLELGGVYYSGQKVTGTYSTITGRLSWVLPRAAVVYFKVDDMGIGAEKTIPDSASADYSDL